MPPKSTRLATRDLPSSPPKQTTKRNTARSTRSRSRDLSDTETRPRSTRSTRNNPNKLIDLSAVQEDDHDLVPQSVADVGSHGDQEAQGDLSGTTAQASQHGLEQAQLDATAVVEELPELWQTTLRLLDLLTRDSSLETVQNILNEVRVPGSATANRLRRLEKKFDTQKENYGTETFIDINHIHRSLFGVPELQLGEHAPDAILQVANIAILAKNLVVSNNKSSNTMLLLQVIDRLFPVAFASIADSTSESDEAASSIAAFELAIVLRTHLAIASLSALQDKENNDPAVVVARVFYHEPEVQEPSLSEYDNYIFNGRLRVLNGIEPDSQEELEYQSTRIQDQMSQIRECFNDEQDAVNVGDAVNFESLDEQFPWTEFLSDVFKWSRSKVVDAQRLVDSRGGIGNIMKSLGEEVKAHNLQIEIDYNLPEASEVIAAPEVPDALPAGLVASAAEEAGKSLLTTSNVRKLAEMKASSTAGLRQPEKSSAGVKRRVTLHGPPLGLPETPVGQAQVATNAASAPAKRYVREMSDIEDDFRPLEADDDEEVPVPASFPASTAQARQRNKEQLEERNKENIASSAPAIVKKRTIFDRQSNAERLHFDDGDEPSQQPFRHPVADAQDDESSSSEDGGFQVDRQHRDLIARRAAPTATATTSHKRPRSPPEEESEDDEGAAEILRRQARRKAQVTAAIASTPAGSAPYSGVRDLAKRKTAIATVRKSQTRNPWSEDDCDRLLQAIARHGAKWSVIHKDIAFDRDCGQVDLKDKARNMKVDYLKTGTHLPLNFDDVTLGQKEMDKVRAVGMNPYRRVGELPGQELVDMDGNEI